MNKIYLLLLWSGLISGAQIGSYSSVLRQDTTAYFPTGEVNGVLGFTKLTNGFVLRDLGTTCTWDAYFPVDGIIALNRGKFYLNRDMVCDSLARFSSPGEIYGQNHFFELPKKRCNYQRFTECGLYLGSIAQAELGNEDEEAHSIDWSYDNKYIAVATEDHVPGELELFSFVNEDLVLRYAEEWWDSLYSVRFRPGERYQIATAGWDSSSPNPPWYDGNGQAGYLVFYNLNQTTTVFEYTSAHQTYRQATNVKINANAVAWRPDGNYLALGLDANTIFPEIIIYSVNAGMTSVTTASNYNLNISVAIDSMDWDTTGSYLVVGAGNYVFTFYFNGTSLTRTYSLNMGTPVLHVDWSNVTNLIAVGLQGGTGRLRLYEFNYGTQSFAEQTESRIENQVAVQAVHWRTGDGYLAVGRDVYTGLPPESEVHIYKYDDTTKLLTCIQRIPIGFDVETVRWSPDGEYFAIGNGGLTIYKFLGPAGDPANYYYLFDDTKIVAGSNTDLIVPMNIQGDCVYYGNKSILDLQTSGSILLRNGSTFLIQDVTIQNVKQGNIRCLGDNCTIYFQDVNLLLDEDFTFDKGHFEVINDLKISGTHKFIYTSDQQSKILSNSGLYLDHGVTFSYDPSITSSLLLSMNDISSRLHLNGCTLHICDPGLEMIKGTMVINNKSYISTEGITGLVLGRGDSVDNDLTIVGEAVLEFQENSVVNYKNIN